MSKKRPLPQPTPAEFEILGVLWRRGPSTVRDVHSALEARGRDVGYTTVLKIMQIMTDKGLAQRDASERSHVYRAAVREDATKRRLVSDLVERAFEGSALGLVMHALSAHPADANELQQIRALLDVHLEGKRP